MIDDNANLAEKKKVLNLPRYTLRLFKRGGGEGGGADGSRVRAGLVFITSFPVRGRAGGRSGLVATPPPVPEIKQKYTLPPFDKNYNFLNYFPLFYYCLMTSTGGNVTYLSHGENKSSYHPRNLIFSRIFH